jgi:hypothetical protein
VKRSVIYVLSHPAWLDETLKSAASVRRHMPDLARELYVTTDLIEQVRSEGADGFTELVAVDAPAFANRPRFESILETNLDQAVFLDGAFMSDCHRRFPRRCRSGIPASSSPT